MTWAARSARPGDLSALEQFYEEVFRPAVAVWCRELFEKHPNVGAENFAIVEDETGRIAGSLVLIPQTWRIDGVDVPTGQIELVATRDEYRGRGVLRTLMHWVAEKQRQLGIVLGCVQGTPVVYQKLGYHFAVDLKGGVRIPTEALPTGGSWRRASEADTPALIQRHERSLSFLDVRSVTSEAIWNYQESQSPESEHAYETYLSDSGYVRLRRRTKGDSLFVCEIDDPYLFAKARAVAEERGARTVVAQLPDGHPMSAWLLEHGGTRIPPYAWQVHVLDWARFIRREVDRPLTLAVADEETIVRLDENGTSVERGRGDEADAVFTRRTLTALVLGYRSLAELEEQFLEVFCRPDAREAINALFPRRRGFVYEIY
ncbi:MAG TPA: GNAT family N-acetyltransferase [Thermoanaerobaculia bacterium]